MPKTAVITIDQPGSVALGKIYRDKTVSDATALLYDMGKEYSFPRQGTPANNDPINDLSYSERTGSFVGQSTFPTFAGGGLDFSGAANATQIVKSPTNVLGGINTNKYWAAIAYIKLPTDADFASATLNANNSIINCSSASAINASGGLFTLGYSLVSTTRRLYVQRGLTATTLEQTNIDTAAGGGSGNLAPFLGTVVQVLIGYKPDGSVIVRLKNASTSFTTTRAAGQAANTADISGKYISAGLLETNRPAGTAKNFRFGRLQIEDLTVTGAPSASELDAWADACWTRQMGGTPRFT